MNPKPKEQAVKFANIFVPAELTDSETQGGGNPNATSIDPGPPAQAPAPLNQCPLPCKRRWLQSSLLRLSRRRLSKRLNPLSTTSRSLPLSRPRKSRTPRRNRTRPRSPTPRSRIKAGHDQTCPSERPKIQVDITTTKVAKADNEWQQRKIEQNKKIEQQRKNAEEARRQAQIAQDKADRAAQEDYAQAHQNYLTAVANANRQSRELAAQRADLLAGAANALRSGLSAGSVIEMPGPGGKAFINYTEYIFTQYYQAWQTPSTSASSSDSVKVEIVVARSGKVISSRIIDKSGDAALDRSVREALSRVQSLPPFPAGTADETRTFKINFTLEAKRTFG